MGWPIDGSSIALSNANSAMSHAERLEERIKCLEEENMHLKHVCSNMQIKIAVLKEWCLRIDERLSELE